MEERNNELDWGKGLKKKRLSSLSCLLFHLPQLFFYPPIHFLFRKFKLHIYQSYNETNLSGYLRQTGNGTCQRNEGRAGVRVLPPVIDRPTSHARSLVRKPWGRTSISRRGFGSSDGERVRRRLQLLIRRMADVLKGPTVGRATAAIKANPGNPEARYSSTPDDQKPSISLPLPCTSAWKSWSRRFHGKGRLTSRQLQHPVCISCGIRWAANLSVFWKGEFPGVILIV